MLVLPVLITTKAANDWYLAYRQCCVVAKKPKSSLIVVGVAVVGIAILGVLALFKCCNVLSLVCTRHSVDSRV